jgi:pimeloyl-ACP methyl ester carboxylesterase
VWEPQWSSFSARYRLLRVDLAGFGRTPIEQLPCTPARDVAGLLDELGLEDGAVSRGDLAAATEIGLRLWVDGPRRTAGDVDPGVRNAVAGMLRRALELQAPHGEDLTEEMLAPDVADRLDEVRAPTLVLVGDEDVDDMRGLAERLAAGMPRARLATIPGAAHLPSLERPALFDELVLDFLSGALGP